ncbi:MAG TPA: hypothetical protein VHX42_03940 [Candidatus Babeliales bacterium]|jgi:hypothetical protein|nr:hypothetical protein [Candidatus Babeliales bacterium]
MLYHLILRDIIEILLYSSCIFTLCQWLRADKTKNITVYFFAYCTLAIFAWIAQMPTLTPFLFSSAPIVLLLFIILHEKTLQRNLITLCSITPAKIEYADWLDTLLSCSLTTINSKKLITVIIEHNNALDHFLTTPFNINADLTKNILDIFLMSSSYDEHKMIWVNTSGKIRGINVTWNNTQETYDDAIIFSAHPISRTFSLIIHGKETKNLSAHHVHNMIKKQLSSLSSSQWAKGVYREHTKSEKTISQ